MLEANQITISRLRKGNPWDNTACEFFLMTQIHLTPANGALGDNGSWFGSIVF